MESKKTAQGAMLALLFLLVPGVVVYLGSRPWLPELASEHGAGIDRMISYLMITVSVIFVIGHVTLAYFVWRFSRQNRVTFRMAQSKNEWKWSLIPVLAMALIAEGGVAVLGMPVWQKFYAASPPPDAVTIEVTAEQFMWNVRYPGNDGVLGRTDWNLISSTNPLGIDPQDPAGKDDLHFLSELHLPVNRPVKILLRSKDVLHSFFLPQLRVKQDAVPGMTITLWFVPTKTGEFELACTELCGLGHYKMRGTLHITSEEEFLKWLDEQTPVGETL